MGLSKISNGLREAAYGNVGGHIVDEVGKFWVVQFPGSESTRADILYETSILDLILQVEGGLDISDIAGFYKTEPEADDRLNELIE